MLGTRSSVIRPSPTPSSTASCTTPIVLRSMGHRCAIPRRPGWIPPCRGRTRRIRWPQHSRNRQQERKNEHCAQRLAPARRCVLLLAGPSRPPPGPPLSFPPTTITHSKTPPHPPHPTHPPPL